MKYKLTILIFLLLIFFIAVYLFWLQAIKPVNPLDKDSRNFVIEKGEDVRSIGKRLEDVGLIRSGLVFFLKARLTNYGRSIQAGNFLLSSSMDMQTIADELLHGTLDVKLTIPEGWRREEIAMKIATQFGIPESEILKDAREGYLFPDTYQVSRDASASDIVRMMEDNFNKKTEKLNRDKLTQNQISFDEMVIIASLIEREAKLDTDRPLIASVILNRLSLGMKLDIDATVQYALGYQAKEKTWWKKELTTEDLEIDSPYNTYKYAGLPPTPIANPGLSVMEAVINAPENEYLYYIADKQGKSHFAKTFEEHAANISKYLNK
ncbi:hypothetical protein A3D78_06125 [Candidatus Gottesmanbacteria bacterium RIFCSPHIGHO2_02_FULL_39_14]|uniref:Endolytic murein transglycosylase n=3 Tax=Candidatus Gottesmaniibacteriota TaxID=1752720 RepID=A0A1F5ZYA2_9BACT|nr:MAG: hypothetical protein A2153_01740 [Candidatus Gottesmanbacteria bacterium RBG_16_38_7b]OGG17430.1 MAG: hypothetical protein A3D78_06125 [Candidatus Gottesmanbacteria bacterium RIFCSPHIGHO2_02_FULL_39_14]OGG31042.1 MAG: hypothetical protein A3I51_01210 [Candidatus Gottesmanbacteria bacterium RIFCSPLOWO2_02_FULL_38_8]